MTRNPAVTGECQGKRVYASLKAARIALRYCRGSLSTLHVYACPRCHHFHLGHKTDRKRAW
jgi:hypothetical protein